jgi:cobalt-zinc-cadmium efflux system membrane fusion protein
MSKQSLRKQKVSARLLALLLLVSGCGAENEAGHAADHHDDDHEAAVDAHPHEDDHDAAESTLGRVSIPDDALAANGVVLARAGTGAVRSEIELPGEIILDADRVAHIVPRFPGVVQKVNKVLGDRVRAGDVLAVVQSNLSAAPYEVTALIDGMVVEKHVTLGEYVRDDADIFVVADLSSVWVNISVYARFLPVIKTGQRVRVTAAGLDVAAEGVIDYVGPIIGESTRTGVARMVLPNPEGRWQPGLFVNAHITVDESRVDVAVPEDAIQSIEGRDVVFVHDEAGYEVRAVELGRRGGGWVEVTDGLAGGEEFVAAGSFIFKAEFGKSEAGHDH